MSDRSSQASGASTSASSEPECGSPSSARSTSGVGGSSSGTGPESPATRMFGWSDEMMDDPREDEIGTLGIGTTVQAPTSALVFNLRGREEGARPELTDSASLRASNGGSSRSYLLTSSVADSPARTCPSPGDEPDSLASDPACSLPPAGEISPSFYARWATSGFTISPGECWTADTSECPKGGDASSSLADVLLETVPERFFLSPRAAAGILRRAEKRGRELPQALAEALRALASAHPDDGRRTTRTLLSTLSIAGRGEPTTTTPRPGILSPPPLSADMAREPTATPPTPSLPTLYEPKDSTPQRTEPGEGHPSSLPTSRRVITGGLAPTLQAQTSENRGGTEGPKALIGSTVRRLTPTECERLQSFPDGWTIPHPTAPDTPPWEMPSPSTSPSGSD